METRVRIFLGAIIAISAIGMMVLKYATHGNMDSYIMPIFLLFLSVVVFSNRSKKDEEQKIFIKKHQKVILPAALIALGSGLITFFITLF